MLILFLKSSQLGLFEAPVQVRGSVRKDGTVIKPHTAMRKKRLQVVEGGKGPVQSALFDVPAHGPTQAAIEFNTHTHKDAVPVAFQPTHELPDGTRVVAHPEESGVWVDGDGNEIEDENAYPLANEARQARSMRVATEPSPVVNESLTTGLDYSLPFEQIPVPGFGVSAGTSRAERKRLNADALALLDAKQDGFTEEDKAVLRQYTGRGGIGDSLNEFYTDPHVAAAMWKSLHNLGFAGGSVLEPSCATGVFLATAPQHARVIGVELDPTSARIAQILHGDRHEVVNTSLERFAPSDLRQFDAVIGNVPFGLRGALIKADKPKLKTAEQYFADAALDKTRDGGLVALIVPTGIMDGQNTRTFRTNLLRKAEFLGAQRLPNSAFEAAHTEVTTDILYLRKRPQEVAGALGTLSAEPVAALGIHDEEFVSGRYFSGRGKDNIFGVREDGWRSKAGMGRDFTVTGSMAGVPAEIAAFAPHPEGAPVGMAEIMGVLKDDPAAQEKARSGALKQPYAWAQPGDVKTVDGISYVLQGQPPRWHRLDEQQASAAVADAQALVPGLDSLFEQARLRVPDLALRAKLAQQVEAYVEKHGIPAKNKELRAAAVFDKTLYRLIGAVNADGSLSDLLAGAKTSVMADAFDTVAQALALEQGAFTPEEISARWVGRNRDTVLDHLFASTQYALEADGQRWTSRDNYLSGDLWARLDAARTALAHEGLTAPYRARYAQQVQWLEEAIDPRSLEDVEVQINSAWVPLDVVAAFFNERKNAGNDWMRQQPDLQIHYGNGVYRVEGGLHEAKLLDKYLNRTGVRQTDLPTIEQWNRDFKTWLAGSDYRAQVEDLYNRKFRGFRQKTHSDAVIPIPGLNPALDVNAYHYAGLRWALEEGKGIIAADVGLGKAQPLDAKVLTPSGWRRMGDLAVGDMVIAGDGTPTRILGVFPQGEKDIYRISFHDGSATECCDEHLWLTQTTIDRNNSRRGCADKGVPKVRTTAEISETLRYLGREKNHTIPMVGAVQFAERPVPIAPYLLGVLLGDGKLGGYTPAISNPEPQIIEACRALLPSGHVMETQPCEDGNGKCPTFHITREIKSGGTRNGVGQAILALGLRSGGAEKFVPDCYKFNTVDIRRAVLQGLMDTDGYVCKQGVTVQFTSVSEALAEDVRFLVNSLGGNATISSKIPTFSHKGEKRQGQRAYTVHLRLPPDLPPFLNSRKRERVRPKSKYLPTRYITGVDYVGRKQAQCILVENASHLYVTDDFVVTHNTGRALMLAKLDRSLGKAQKPTFVVPKSVLANWVAEAEFWFPGSKVLTIGETYSRDKHGELVGREDSAAERDRKYHALSQNSDYDFVFISEPAFNDLDLDPETKHRYVSDDFWVQRGDTLGNAGDKRVKRIRESYEQSVASREFQQRSEAIYFNDLGIDRLYVDEAHHYKNLYAARNRFGEQPKFLGGQGLSNRALDLNLKARWVREQNDGKGVYGLTATPTKNSPLEIYSMISHVAPEAFERIGIRNSEDFLDRFAEFAMDNVLTVDGQIEQALVTVGFKNLDELREIMRRYIDRKTAEDVGLALPAKDERMHLVEMAPEQEAVYAELRKLADKSNSDQGENAHIFAVMDKMAKAAMDLELLDSKRHAGFASPKYAAVAKAVVEGIPDGGQIVFADHVGAHEKIAKALVKAGVPRVRIAIVNAKAAKSSAQRQNISDRFNRGELDVVIGNTPTMGEGMNLQKRTADIHDMDIPWDPATLQQRHGRGVRQGNRNETVRLHAYLSKGSFDGYRYQTMSAKRDWQDLLWNGGDRVENLAREGQFSRDELMILLAADPEAARKQYEENKTAAEERQAAAGRAAAAGTFVRFQAMRRSLRALKGKQSASAARLEAQIARARTSLAADKHFLAKDALTVDMPVLIQPETGTAWHAGRAFEMAPGTDAPLNWSADKPSRWVVTGVDLDHAHIRARPYGSLSADQTYTVPLDKLNRGVRPVDYDEEAELQTIAEKSAQSEKAGAAVATNPGALKGVRPETIRKIYPIIQEQLRESFRSYKDRHQPDHVLMLDGDGRPVAFPSYEARKHLDTHELMLPLPEHRDKALEGWIAAENAKRITTRYVQKRRNSDSRAEGIKARYANYKESNPWTQAAREMYGDEFEQEAK